MASDTPEGLWTEPESAANEDNQPVYPYNNVTQTESGHSIEMDDTPSRERIRIQHGPSKTFIEMHPNGDVVHKIYGDGYEIVAGAKNVMIKGVCNITIEGDCNMHVLGNKTEKIEGDYNLQVVGSLTTRAGGADGITLISDKDMTIQSNSLADGALYIQAGDHMYLSSDLQVAGAISADVVSAKTRVNAGTGVYAGPLGMYSQGLITSLVSVNAPIGNFPAYVNCGIMDAVMMTDTINSGIYNSHIHPTPKGPSGPPISKFIGI